MPTEEEPKEPAPLAPHPAQGLAPPVLAGRVLDRETRRPIPGARVQLRWIGGDGATTDRDGGFAFSLACYSDQVCVLRAVAPRHAPEDLRLAIDPREARTEIEIPLTRGADVDGRVTEGPGEPIAGAPVSIAPGGMGRWGSTDATRATEDGRFRFTAGVAEGRAYWLAAAALAAALAALPGCHFLERGNGRVRWAGCEYDEREIDALICKVESGQMSKEALGTQATGDIRVHSLGELHAAKSASIVRHAPFVSATAVPISMGIELMRAPESIPGGIGCFLLIPLALPFDAIILPVEIPIRVVNHLCVSEEDLDRSLRSLSRARRFGYADDFLFTGDMLFYPKTLDAIGYDLPCPGPCPPTLETVHHGLRTYLDSLRPPGAPPGRYRLSPDRPPSLAASSSAAMLRWLMKDLTARAERKAWIEEIASQQDPKTGEWPGEPRRPDAALRALHMLRGKPRHPLPVLKAIEEPASMEAWLDARDWRYPWRATIEIRHAAMPFASGDIERTWLDRFFARLEAHQDPRTGFWGTSAGASLEDGMAATFHLVPVYRAARRSIPHADAIVESVLALRTPDGSFRSGYGQVDACHLLRMLCLETPGLPGPRDHAREALRGVFRNLLGRWDPHAAIFRGAVDLHEVVAIYEVLVLTAPAAEDHPLARLAWRDAWDPALWKGPVP
ncbi:MAG: carboxypeptidase regulatory-like domain-containing protein [Planctomycetes bacterium]|nr:carboxypeptidase regulatory-like domain-containing protein [Planctomycetota bacterium]